MIDVIIPAYNAHDTIEETLCSIAYQDFSDNINVYIVNDCSHSDYSKFVDFYSKFINICELVLDKNSGPGRARQYGIEHSNSDYIVFIDSDDAFSDSYALRNLYNEINNTDYDMVVSSFVQETNNGFILKNNETIWLHGKIYRRKFIEKNNISFSDTRVNEDSGFNQSLLLANCNVKYTNIKTYIWRNNSNSITRKDLNSVMLNGTIEYAINIYYALQTGIRLNGDNVKIGRLAFAALVYIYCCFLEYYKDRDNDKTQNLLRETKKIKEIVLKYPISDNMQTEVLHDQIAVYYNDTNRHYFLKTQMSFINFFNMLDEV